MRIFLSVTAILAWVISLALLLMPKQFFEPMGIELTPLLATIPQAQGATLFGLGVVNWLGRNAEKRGLIAILGGNLVVQFLSILVLIRSMSLGTGAAVAPGMVLHVVLGSLCAYFLLKARKM
jgi:hypothetical protein